MANLNRYDAAVALTVDRRYAAEWPRIQQTFGPLVKSLTAYIDGDGRLLHPEMYDQLRFNLPPDWNQGQGAYQHFRAVQEIISWAKSDNLESVLLIEDDAVLTGDGLQIIELADQQIKDLGFSWDILYYGANHTDAITEQIAPHVLRVNGSLTTHMVGFKHTVYDAILNLKPTHVIDNLIARFLHPKYKALSLWPAAAVQKPGRSYLWNQEVDYTELFKNKGKNH